jgi:hypothetical protein
VIALAHQVIYLADGKKIGHFHKTLSHHIELCGKNFRLLSMMGVGSKYQATRADYPIAEKYPRLFVATLVQAGIFTSTRNRGLF